MLEMGFGGGAMLPTLLATAARVSGVDRWVDMVRRASIRYRAEVAARHADFRVGVVETLPFESEQFDKAYKGNTVYFWTSLAVGAAEARRVLEKGGQLPLGSLPPKP